MTDQRATFFDKLGADYIAPVDDYVRAYHERRFEIAYAMLHDIPRGSLYEFGCGSGEFLKRMKRFSPRKGMDLSAAMVKLAIDHTGCTIAQGGVQEFLKEELHYTVIVALNVLPYLSIAEEATFLGAAKNQCDYLLVSHANELFDLVTFNRFTVEFYRQRLLPLLPEEQHGELLRELRALMTRPDDPPRTNEAHQGSERDHLPKRLVDPFFWKPEGYDIVRWRGVNPHPLPPAILNAHADLKLAALDLRIAHPSLERLFCSQFQVLLKPVIEPRTASTVKRKRA